MNRVEFIMEEYRKYADGTWRLSNTERVPERGYSQCLKNGQYFFYGNPIQLNMSPDTPNCGAYFKVADIVREKDYSITDKVLCEFNAIYLRPIPYVIGVIVYRNSMPTYFCHPKARPSGTLGYPVWDCEFTEDIMQLRKWLIRKFKGNMYFDEKNRKAFAEII